MSRAKKVKKQKALGVALVCRVYGIEPGDMNRCEVRMAGAINAAIKRAVREAYDAGFSDHEDNDAYGSEKMNKKYGTNL